MGPFGVLLMLIGAGALVFGCTMDVAAPGSRIVNLSLMQQQQMTVMVGIGLMILGGIFVAVGAARRTPAAAGARATTGTPLPKGQQDEADVRQALAEGRTASEVRSERLVTARRPCPLCAEAILPAAIVCPFCRRDLPEGWSAPIASTMAATPRDQWPDRVRGAHPPPKVI